MRAKSVLISIGELEKKAAIVAIQDGNHGEKHPKATDYVDDGIPFIMANNVVNNNVDIDNSAKIPPNIAENLRIGFARNGDVLLTHKGTIGSTAIVNTDLPYLMLTPQVTYYRTDSNKLINRFLSYAFQEPLFQKTMKSLAQQATRPYIGITAQRKLKVRWRSIDEQRRIATILSAYDDLIENNRRRIQLLENAARLLYKEWFVHLRFPGHEHVKIKNGVPEGWEKRKISEVCDTVGGGTPSTKVREYWNGDITWIVPTDVTRNDCLVLLDSARKITSAGLRKSSAKLVPSDTILMTSRASVGYFALVNKEVCTNQGFINIIPHNGFMRMYILFNLIDRVNEIRANAKGTTYPEISKGRFREMLIVIPSMILLKEFFNVANNIICQVNYLKTQTVKLQQARDLLLPRLMNGEIAV